VRGWPRRAALARGAPARRGLRPRHGQPLIALAYEFTILATVARDLPARIVAVANTKGGVGKSTLAANLAWAFATHAPLRRRVLLVDADPQASVTKWFDLAPAELPFDRLQLTTARVLHGQLPRLLRQHDVILVDCPPMDSHVTAAAIATAHLGLIPVLPSPMDMLAYSTLLPVLRQAQAVNAGLRLRLVVNQLSPRTVLAREVQESLTDTEIPLCPTQIHLRQIYRRAIAAGTAAGARPGPARDEIVALAKDVLHALHDRAPQA
jgi:chromosome partitioning protein